MTKKGQTPSNNENVRRIKMLAPLYSPRMLDIFHQRGKVIDRSPASKSSAPSETKCLTSPSLSRPQTLSRTTWPETHRPRIMLIIQVITGNSTSKTCRTTCTDVGARSKGQDFMAAFPVIKEPWSCVKGLKLGNSTHSHGSGSTQFAHAPMLSTDALP